MDEEREMSIASSSDFYESDSAAKPQAPAQNTAPTAKRKATELENVQEKKRKIEVAVSLPEQLSPCAGLPPEIWQHIFLSCSTSTLGRLLQVNRTFHTYLTAVQAVPHVKPSQGCLSLLKSESVWASVRNAHPTKPPKPLIGFSELQMCQLAYGKNCQFCGKVPSGVPGEKMWQKGPGEYGVRTIWPFNIRTCGPCLLERFQTDSSLLFSTASALRPALPFAFITNDNNYIPAHTLQSTTTPASVEITKYYYKPHVEDIMQELEQAQSLGPAAAEEWSKGLDARGKERMKSAENWERWQPKYQWWSDHQKPRRSVSTAATSPAPVRQQLLGSPLQHAPSPIGVGYVPPACEYYGPFSAEVTSGLQNSSGRHLAPFLTNAATAPQYFHHRPPTIPPHQLYTPQPGVGGAYQPPRTERNIHDANEAKAARKADIERRCQELTPPIPPNILRHMDSFKAAIQISQPMSEYAWSVLYPRLLAHLPAAEQAEAEHASHTASIPSRLGDRRQDYQKDTKDVLDREWEEAQRPIRDLLGALADDFINRDWSHGRAVTYENSPKFAADLLIHVRRMYVLEAAKNEEVSANSDKSKLVLEHMKWVYDNKLKPITEQYRKELFLCHGPGCEGNARYYGFEGVVQHFGAKHTNAFSVGNVVVAWREAEWPEETPFHPYPISVRHSGHAASGSSGQGQPGYGSYYGGYSRAGTSTPHMQAHLPQTSPGPYNQQYGNQYRGPFAPPSGSSVTIPGYEYPQPYGPGSEAYSGYQPMGALGYGLPTGPTAYMTSPGVRNVAAAHGTWNRPDGSASKDPSPRAEPSDGEYRTNSYDKEVSTVIQMAQDLWKHTSGIKDLPNSVRVYVLLQRVISKFQLEFNHEPSLSHFVDALSNHQVPKALKQAPGLSCKACQEDIFRQSSYGHQVRTEERRSYTVLSLFSHFKSQHAGPQTPGHGHLLSNLDFREEMVELPSDRLISGLIHAPGMDDDKLLTIATVFPGLFPAPLPRIGVVDGNGVASPTPSSSKDHKEAPKPAAISGNPTERSGPSSIASAYADSPRPVKPGEDEYDPRRPALLAESRQAIRATNRKASYRGASPPSDRRPRYYTEPRYYLPADQFDEEFGDNQDFAEFASESRTVRDSGDWNGRGRHAIIHDHEAFYEPDSDGVFYPRPREQIHGPGYRAYPPDVLHQEGYGRRVEYRRVSNADNPLTGQSRAKEEVDRFLQELDASEPSGASQSLQTSGAGSNSKPATTDQDPDDGSRYSPPPPNVPHAREETKGPLRPAGSPQHRVPNTSANGPRFEEHKSSSRQITTPDSGGGPRRNPPHRRRDRPQHDYVPSRYYRYMSAARDEPPYVRGSSMSRSQSRRYERYEQTRRRIDQQETPQPNPDRDFDPTFSRDQSVERGPPEDPYVHPQQAHAEYVPVQERTQYATGRVRYAAPPGDARGAPVYVDEYGHPVEVIRIPRDRGPYVSHPPPRYVADHESEHIQYVSVPYGRPPPQFYDGRPDPYVYYEERERPPRRPAYQPEEPYDPEIEAESMPPAAATDGP